MGMPGRNGSSGCVLRESVRELSVETRLDFISKLGNRTGSWASHRRSGVGSKQTLREEGGDAMRGDAKERNPITFLMTRGKNSQNSGNVLHYSAQFFLKKSCKKEKQMLKNPEKRENKKLGTHVMRQPKKEE